MIIKNAIFDMDGTLVDSMPIWRCTQLDIIEEFYGIVFLEEERNYLLHMTYAELLVAAARVHSANIIEYDVSLEANKRMAKLYLSGTIKTKPYVHEYLKCLKNNGCGVALATATCKKVCIPFLKKIGLYQYFDCIYTTEDDAKIGKAESSAVYDLALKALGGTKDNTAVFEDVPVCIKTCKNNGYYTIAVHDELQTVNIDIIKQLADKYISSYKELIK